MKSFSVKSNAKRFARGIAAKSPELFEVMEPRTEDDGATWLPCLFWNGPTKGGAPFLPHSEIALTAIETCVLMAPAMPEIAAKLNAPFVSSTTPKTWEEIAANAAPDMVAVVTAAVDVPVTLPMAPARACKTVSLAELAATLPPLVVSTPEEIEARRAERRARIDADKSNPKPKPEKISRKQIILDLVGIAGGATVDALEAATGWQRHTLRGYIAGTLRKELAPKRVINCVRKKGEPTRYVMKMKGGDA